ncbi:MAG: hypothetical protein QRY74_01910 [Chlamydia sp.]
MIYHINRSLHNAEDLFRISSYLPILSTATGISKIGIGILCATVAIASIIFNEIGGRLTKRRQNLFNSHYQLLQRSIIWIVSGFLSIIPIISNTILFCYHRFKKEKALAEPELSGQSQKITSTRIVQKSAVRTQNRRTNVSAIKFYKNRIRKLEVELEVRDSAYSTFDLFEKKIKEKCAEFQGKFDQKASYNRKIEEEIELNLKEIENAKEDICKEEERKNAEIEEEIDKEIELEYKNMRNSAHHLE